MFHLAKLGSPQKFCPATVLAGISDFGEDIVSEAGSDSGGISSHDGSKNNTDSDYNTEPSIISTWGGSRGGSSGSVEPPKVKSKNFYHTFSCEKRSCQITITIR